MTNDTPYRVLLMRGRGPLSTAIRLRTGGPFSHSAYHIGGGHILEAWHKGGVREHHLSDWRNVIPCSISGFNLATYQAMETAIRRHLGEPYDWPAILAFALGIPRAGHAVNGRWFCSELDHYAARQAAVETGIYFDGLTELADNAASPNDLWRGGQLFPDALP